MYQTVFNKQSIIAISDTHGRHRELSLPAADILIHCGDACNGGDTDELADFFDWYAGLPARYRIFIPGNHDLPFELEPDQCPAMIPPGVTWLRNKISRIAGIRIGALEPHFYWTDSFAGSGEKTDILLSHAPPYGILDRHTGCRELHSYVMAAQPAFHFFGHIHEEAGKTREINDIHFVNTCVFNH